MCSIINCSTKVIYWVLYFRMIVISWNNIDSAEVLHLLSRELTQTILEACNFSQYLDTVQDY
jgi:hypothetical protein